MYQAKRISIFMYFPPVYQSSNNRNFQNILKKHYKIKYIMDIEQQTKSTFLPVSPALAAKISTEAKLLESYFTENVNSPNYVILTLTKNYIIARSTSATQAEKVFAAEINFDLKFESIYLQQKNVHSKKIGIKFLISTTEFNCFYSADIAVLELWILNLSKQINQKGFHELFKPIKKLGKGNFASVYEVERLTDLKRFAVKAFSKQNTFAAKNGKESLMNELAVMRSLNHSNILRLESVFESDNSIYVVLQVLSGDQLFHKIQKAKGHFSKIEIKTFMKGLLQGLAHMHENRIMHRDLKPENIMLRDENSMDPVIVDFGLATNADIPKYLFYRCGTPGYVAPEIVSLTDNSHVEPQCDIFSAGVIFHILLMRKPLFEGTKYDQVYRNNKLMKFDLNTAVYSKLETEQLDLLKRMLAENPSERITAVEALKNSFFSELKKQEYEKQLNSPQLTSTTQKAPKIRKIIKV